MNGATEHLRPEEGGALSRDEFARIAGISQDEVRELLAYGLLTMAKVDLPTALAMREAVRLQKDFDLDLFSTGLLAGYIEKIHELQGQLRAARAEFPLRAMITEASFTSIELRHRSVPEQ